MKLKKEYVGKTIIRNGVKFDTTNESRWEYYFNNGFSDLFIKVNKYRGVDESDDSGARLDENID